MIAEPQMVGEDFARFGQTEHQVPTVLFWLGTIDADRMNAKLELPGLHSPFYYPDPENSLTTGIKVMTQTLMDLLPT